MGLGLVEVIDSHPLMILILSFVGPVLMTAGPWKPISLETYEARITDIDIRSKVSEDLSANLDVNFTLSRDDRSIASVTLKGPDGSMVIGQSSIKISNSNARAQFKLSPGAYELWYPVGYGKQPVYTVEIEVADQVLHHPSLCDDFWNLHTSVPPASQHGRVLDAKVQKIAFRRARIVQDPLVDQEGRTFLFEINNIRIFCGGI